MCNRGGDKERRKREISNIKLLPIAIKAVPGWWHAYRIFCVNSIFNEIHNEFHEAFYGIAIESDTI